MTTDEQITALLAELQKHPDALDDCRSHLRTFTNTAFAVARSAIPVTEKWRGIEGARLIFRDNLLLLCAHFGITPPVPFPEMKAEVPNDQG